SANTLSDWSNRMMEKMRADPVFRDVTSDSQNRGLQASLRIDRDKANLLGVQIADIRNALYDAFGERQVSTIYSSANSYLVILEASDADRRFEDGLAKINLRGKNGALVPITAFATVDRTVGPTAVNHQGQLQAIMMIDFALDAQRSQGLEPKDAIREACRLRFRPILMTTMAALMGALPMAFGLGAGAELRQPLGIAVSGGLVFSQIVTLYITP